MDRLDKLTANAFGISRAQAQAAIRKGRVAVEGEACLSPEKKFDPASRLSLDGTEGGYEKYIYIMMDKPAGYVSATEDSRDPTALELLPEELCRRRLGIVGRLDKDATGLLLITDDGELNHRLTSPKYHMDKTYFALLDHTVGEKDIAAFVQGMELSDFTAMPAKLVPDENDPHRCLVTVAEGKFHQVKRMFEKRGRKVLELRRLSIGGLELDPLLGEGNYRKLTPEEIAYLQEKCGIKQENQK